MATTQVRPGASGSDGVASGPGVPVRALLVVPLAWVVVALVHPQGNGDVYEALADKVNLWLGVHLVQLVLALGLAAVLWTVLAGRTSRAATVARAALPVWLVAFAAFDAVAGIGSGLAVRHANALAGPDRAGAASAAEYLLDNRIAGDLSPVWFVQAVALITAVIATALVLRSAGASRPAFVAMLVGALLVFHAGPVAAVGLVAIAAAIFLADRDGCFATGQGGRPA